MSLRPTAIALARGSEIAPADGLYVVIRDPDVTGPLLIPASWNHRRIDVTDEQLAEHFELHPARIAHAPADHRLPIGFAAHAAAAVREAQRKSDHPLDVDALEDLIVPFIEQAIEQERGE